MEAVCEREMFAEATRVFVATRKKHDQPFNVYVMRPLAAAVVAWLAPTQTTPNQVTLVSLGVFVMAAATFALWPSYVGGLVAVLLVELSYLFDCADGMLARYKGLASKEGHLFDFFTDELKALLLTAGLALRLFRSGGLSPGLSLRPPEDPTFLILGIFGVLVVASAISLTNFVRRPELSGRETTVEAHYEAAPVDAPRTPVGWAMAAVRFVAHYPSHLYAFALIGCLDVFLELYIAVHLAYLVRGWVGLVVRFGKAPPPLDSP